MSVAIVIPAYNPDLRLGTLVKQLLETRRFCRIVVVNDGSQEECEAIFAHLESLAGVTVLHHAVNLGKGAALKTGLNHCLWAWPEAAGVVTADADGQHLVGDIVRVADALDASPGSLILGSRQFVGDVPWRSRMGNAITRHLFHAAVGARLTDTQSGLRGIPRKLAMYLLHLRATGYEFELDMLIQCKHHRVPIIECPIETVYLDENRSSHFNPVFDSMRIYFVLARFIGASLLTAAVDYVLFLAVFRLSASILLGQSLARLVATGVNFALARRVVFHSRAPVSKVFAKFCLLVAAMGAVSYLLIQAFVHGLGWSVVTAKVVSELLVYVANFAIQRDVIFLDPLMDASAASAAESEAEPVALKKAA